MTDYVTVKLPCEACGAVAAKTMSLEDARTFANGVLAAVDGLRPGEWVCEDVGRGWVRGEG